MGEALNWTDVTSHGASGTLRFITSFLKFPIFTEKGPGWGVGALAIYFCVLGMSRPQGYVFTIPIWEGCCFSGPIVWQRVLFLILV